MSVTLSPSKFKGINGQWLTAALFIENRLQGATSKQDSWAPQFCLYGEVEGLISCEKTFIEVADPTGLRWAKKYLGGYEHLQMLLRSVWFKEAFEAWKHELSLKSEMDALEIIREIAVDQGNKARFQAAKFIIDYNRKKPASKRGRPSDEEVTGELKKEVEARKSILSDAERIGLRVIDGGKTNVL